MTHLPTISDPYHLEPQLEQILDHVFDREWFTQNEAYLHQLMTRAINTPPMYLIAVQSLRICLRNLLWHVHYGRWSKIVSDAMLIAMDRRDSHIRATMYICFGEFMALQGEYRMARHAAETALAMVGDGGNEIIELEAIILLILAQTQHPEPFLEKKHIAWAINISKRARNQFHLRGRLFQNLGLHYTLQGNMRAGHKFAQLAYKNWRIAGSEQVRIESLVVHALITSLQGDEHRFSRIHGVVMPRLSPDEGGQIYAAMVHYQADFASASGRHEEAAKLYQEMIEQYQSMNFKYLVALGMQKLGMTYIQLGSYFSALRWLSHAHNGWKHLRAYHECIHIRLGLAQIALQKDRLERSAQLIGEAASLTRELKSPVQRQHLQMKIEHLTEAWIERLKRLSSSPSA